MGEAAEALHESLTRFRAADDAFANHDPDDYVELPKLANEYLDALLHHREVAESALQMRGRVSD